jgi:hypothetical protein
MLVMVDHLLTTGSKSDFEETKNIKESLALRCCSLQD